MWSRTTFAQEKFSGIVRRPGGQNAAAGRVHARRRRSDLQLHIVGAFWKIVITVEIARVEFAMNNNPYESPQSAFVRPPRPPQYVSRSKRLGFFVCLTAFQIWIVAQVAILRVAIIHTFVMAALLALVCYFDIRLDAALARMFAGILLLITALVMLAFLWLN